jgi:hypothetical protein
MEEIRKMTGICPQHDVLFDELSPREHLQFFARIRVRLIARQTEIVPFRRSGLFRYIASAIYFCSNKSYSTYLSVVCTQGAGRRINRYKLEDFVMNNVCS